MRAEMPDVASSPGRIAAIINFFVGVWILVSPFVLGFSDASGATWNNVIVGAVVMAIAGGYAWGRMDQGLNWINFVLGLWLIVSAFIYGFQMNPGLTWNQVLVGVVVTVLSALCAMAQQSTEPTIAP